MAMERIERQNRGDRQRVLMDLMGEDRVVEALMMHIEAGIQVCVVVVVLLHCVRLADKKIGKQARRIRRHFQKAPGCM